MHFCRIRIFYIFNFIVVSIVMSCNNHQHPEKKIFRYNESAGIATLDPAYAKNQSVMWPMHQLYNTLLEVDDSMNIIPSLAKSWVFSADKKTITFHLRNDIYFHDDPVFPNGKGRKMIAGDVVYSLSRIVNPSVASPGAWIFNDKIDSLKPFVALDDSTFVLNLKAPFLPVLGILTMKYCSVVPEEAVIKYGNDFRRHPVGTGPFCFTAWEEGQALILKKNEHYFEKDSSGRQLPYLDGIKVSFFENKSTEFLEFQQGRLDFINDIDVSYKDDVLTKNGNLKLKWQHKINLSKHPYFNTEYLGILNDTNNILVKHSPLRDKRIRQAINYGIDRKKMMMYMRNSIGFPANSGFVPIGFPSFDSSLVKGYTYNPEKAKSLIREAGYDEQHPMPQIKLVTVPTYAAIATYIANELNAAGIPLVVEVMQKGLLLEQMSKSQLVFFRGSWIADYPDASNYLGVFYGKNPAPPNYTRYNNPVYDEIFESSLRELNDSVRIAKYRMLDVMLMEDAPIVPLWYDMVLHLSQKNISGFKPNALNMLELRSVQKK